MPISPIVLQRRHAEIGRIRLGDKGAKGQPQRLNRFRITSANQRHIEDIAQLYGGTAQPWRNGTRDEWEVYTDATTIPVIVVKGGISQWLETWSGGGCVHRCDGHHNVLTDTDCDPADPAHQAAKPTTRLSVMLRELDAIGVFRLETHGWNAAAELPGLVELAMYVGDLVPANLYLAERVQIKDGRTSRFVVPGLDLEVAPARLAALVSAQAASVAVEAAPQRPAIEHQPAGPDYFAMAGDTVTVEEVRAIWSQARDAGHLDDDLAALLTRRVEFIKAGEQEAARPAAADAQTQPAVATAEDPDALWDAIVREAGRLGWTTSHLSGEFEGYHAIPPRDANPDQLAVFLTYLKTQEGAA